MKKSLKVFDILISSIFVIAILYSAYQVATESSFSIVLVVGGLIYAAGLVINETLKKMDASLGLDIKLLAGKREVER